MAITCKLKEYTVKKEDNGVSVLRNVVLLASISALVACIFLGASFLAGPSGKRPAEKHPASQVAKEGSVSLEASR